MTPKTPIANLFNNKRGAESFLGLIVIIFFFAAMSVLCLFLVWYLSGQDTRSTEPALQAIDRNLALDIIKSQSTDSQVWRIVDANAKESTKQDEELMTQVNNNLNKIKVNCAILKSSSYSDNQKTQLINVNSKSCTNSFVIELPQSFAVVSLDVSK